MISEIVKILKDANIDEPQAKAKIILRELANLSAEDIFLGKEIKNKAEVLDFAEKLAKTGAPLQHLLGYWYFMGEKFIVTPDTLIPREETEFLVKCALDKAGKIKKETVQILDIGTGSGCIACMIAKNAPQTEVLGVDISLNALQVALENVQKLDLIKKVVFRKSDIFSALREGEKFDIIVSNPPYISEDDYNNLDKVVKDFEPKSALLAGESGLEFYKKIIRGAKKYLNKGGYLIFECGHNQADEICKLFEKHNFTLSDIICDMAGIKRVVCAN
ncbi:TPA: peptide chain release factor N(5)-glutamine methyltransferase [Candidatus Galligastranaerophilus intestinavium]|uniref:Peptide chain release factor N(5)-glutamine methyltransferase n=1 Tax=Candidatus Galligastranaerophilus intestinavium TaxID=2840836 RepID=A0A9D1JYA0_9BACT|nr:peptide chain release factor N(5)-glutamine methyltransferase [Candidatus Galligastranaerophilus intestinavium]